MPTRGNPPQKIIDRAVEMANMSPCAKSHRGSVVFFGEWIYGEGFNEPPYPFICKGAEACGKDCNKVAVHAEQKAIIAASLGLNNPHRTYELLHVKTVDYKLVAGGPPSCWQCSRLAMLSNMFVWLYEDIDGGVWNRYNPEEFHSVTLTNCKLPECFDEI